MYVAYVDIGNTKTKISFVKNDVYTFGSSILNSKLMNKEVIGFGVNFECLDKVYIACVAKKNVLNFVVDYFVEEQGVKPVLLKTKRECLGLVNGYSDFSQLGIDRWLAMLAVSEECKSYIVISSGTAITVDVVVDCRHQGGFIVPGLVLMQSAIFSNTAIIDTDSSVCQDHGFLPNNTQNGVVGGTLYMAGSFINSIINDVMSETGVKINVFASGGDFSTIQPLINHDVTVVEDLVIQGMIKLNNAC